MSERFGSKGEQPSPEQLEEYLVQLLAEGTGVMDRQHAEAELKIALQKLKRLHDILTDARDKGADNKDELDKVIALHRKIVEALSNPSEIDDF